jgi:hypothetical protein
MARRLEGWFRPRNKVKCSFFLWTLSLAFGGFTLNPVEGSNSQILLANSFSAHLFGLSTKFDHSIPQPLNSDGHNVKRPYIESLEVGEEHNKANRITPTT